MKLNKNKGRPVNPTNRIILSEHGIRQGLSLQNPPTSLSHQQWLVGTFRNSFERDFTCNNILSE